jgi:hypothetical protein
MTETQIILTMWPAAYVMFCVSESQARLPFVLIGAVGVLFSGFALDFRRMLLVRGGVPASYAAVVSWPWRCRLPHASICILRGSPRLRSQWF